MKIKKIFEGRNKWLAFFYAAILTSIILSYITACTESVPTLLQPLIKDFGGNLTAGIIGGFMFLFLTFYLDAQTEEKIDKIKAVTEKSELTLAKREAILENERRIFEFEQFLKNETYHDVRFPDLKTDRHSIGLEYTIQPVRDKSTNEPLVYENEMEKMHLVRVIGPAHISVLKKEDLADYNVSPIREDEYYFCRFFNGSWHMGTDSPFSPYKFYLSGKVGPVQFGQSANQYMSSVENPFVNCTLFSTVYLNVNGDRPASGEGCDKFELYKNDSDGVFLKINESLPKKIYMTNPENTHTDSGWYMVIKNIRGYASDTKLEKLIQMIQSECQKNGINIPKIPWYNTDEFKYEH